MKQIKLLGVLALALSLGLAACGGAADGGDGEGSSGSSKHVHTFDTTKWESNDSQHWHPATCEHKTQKGDAKAHTFGEPYDVHAATCTEDGYQMVKCTVCEREVRQTLTATGHSAEPAADAEGVWTPITEATCEEDGKHSYVCTQCHQPVEVTIPKLNHLYAKDPDNPEEDLVQWSQVATCTKDGVGTKTCTRPGCGHVENVTKAALGHKFETTDTTQPEAGKAAVRVYTCQNGCGESYLGFKANEVSEESKKHLNIGDDGGAAFWGRPIGNAIALDSTGTSVNKTNNECVYCSTETGDFFEYVFDLTKAQADTLATCRCYCDARPADHLNTGDFWAYNASADDWTPGYYIDGADEHVEKDSNGEVLMVKDHALPVRGDDGSEAEGVETENMVKQGKRITDYRYVLYVDNEIQQFDPDTKVPCEGNGQNMVRKEYVMPFTFHLHEGTNRISLRMAGGYRSTFYNFTFRPYVEPTQLTVNNAELSVEEGKTVAITSTFEELKYASSNSSVATVDANGVVTGVKAGTATITVSKEGNFKPVSVKITVTETAGVTRAEVENGTSEGNVVTFRTPSGAGVSGDATNAFPKDAVLTIKFQSTLTGKFTMSLNARGGSISGATNVADAISVKVNNAAVTLSGEIAGGYTFSEVVIGEVDLTTGENTIAITALLDSMPNLDYFRFVPKA